MKAGMRLSKTNLFVEMEDTGQIFEAFLLISRAGSALFLHWIRVEYVQFHLHLDWILAHL